MAPDEQQLDSHHPQRIRQAISVPFLWEEKPGTPKRGWKIPDAALFVSAPSPARLVISVPFEWEEKPGKPFLFSTNPFIDYEDEDVTLGWDLGDSAKLRRSSSEESSIKQQNWCSFSETDSQSSSAAENASTDHVLGFLFPLSSPDAGFLNEEGARTTTRLVKRTLTLGELILLSRKLSYRRRTIEARKPGLLRQLQAFIQKNLPISFPFRTSIGKHNPYISNSQGREPELHRSFSTQQIGSLEIQKA